MSSLEKNNKWTFPLYSKSDMGQGGEDASFASFREFPLRSLIREYTQNSLDVHASNPEGPVKVSLSGGVLKCSDYPELIGSLLPHLKGASQACQAFENGKDPFAEKAELLRTYLDADSIPYLKFSDYNTTGMSYSPEIGVPSGFSSCVRTVGGSYKNNSSAAGSHGLGKSVGFVCSAINAVVYSTLTEDGKSFCEGVTKLCNRKVGDRYFKPHAYYDAHEGEDPSAGDHEIPEVFRRETPGTDAFVLGRELNEEDLLTINKETLRSFFMAIYKGQLVVDIFGEEFNSSNLNDKFNDYFPLSENAFDTSKGRTFYASFNPRPYFEEAVLKAGSDENHVKIDSDIDFPEKYPDFSGILYLWKDDSIKSHRDRIVSMRDKLLTIEIKQKNSHKGYYAVLVVNRGSEALRNMENVTHDFWKIEHVANESAKSKARKVQKQMEAFLTDALAKIFPAPTEGEQKIEALRDIRINTFSSQNSASEDEALWASSTIIKGEKDKNPRSKTFKAIETGMGKKQKRSPQGPKKPEGVTPPKKPGEEPPTPPVPPSPKPPKPEPPEPKPHVENPSGETYHNTPQEDEESPILHKRKVEFDIRPADIKLIPTPTGEFSYKLKIRTSRDRLDCSLSLSVLGLGKKPVPLKLERVSSGCKITGEESNTIQGFDLLADSENILYFTPKEKALSYTLIPKAYETK